MSSTMNTVRSSRITACASRAPRPTSAWSRRWKSPGKRFYIGVQFHPEFKSRPNKAHPLFREFIKASLDAQAEKHD